MLFCPGHGNRQRRLGLDRYEVRDMGHTTPCWVWLGQIAPVTGYGLTYTGFVPRRKVGAHRAVFEAHRGPIPTGLDLDHLCRVRACVNPEHLEPVTRGENLRRGTQARRGT